MKMEVHVFVSSAQIGRRHAYISVIMKTVQRKENKIDAHTHSLSAKKEKLHPSTKGSSNWREHHWSYIITIIRWLSSQKAFCMQIQSCVQCIRPGWSPSVQETSLRTQLCILRNPAVKAIANQTHLVRHICASPFAGKLKGFQQSFILKLSLSRSDKIWKNLPVLIFYFSPCLLGMEVKTTH